MVRYFTQKTRLRFGLAPLTTDLVIKGTPKDIRSLKVKEPVSNSEHAATLMHLTLQGSVNADKQQELHGGGKYRLTDLGLGLSGK